ncbi:hypothetical protein DL546_001717 [Coniochaeta pulveracea]|uniref:Ribosomal protein bL31m N-terminal domain-containing protein n=1 Tax=Coniochaeta pulveracea TaxID=177199 RepID=A0A420YAI4_9PEZI|nr:hypothetical protein DL546_001717 [Coniochaeta pulveracea]
MAPKLPTTSLLTSIRPTTSSSSSSPSSLRTHQIRHATFVPRSRRPYTFTQLIQLSDGSTYTTRTTSPLAIFKSTKDTRNHALWQPSDSSLRNVEVDEAEGDAATEGAEVQGKEAKKAEGGLMSHDSFADLISGYAEGYENVKKAGGLSAKEQARADKKKKK